MGRPATNGFFIEKWLVHLGNLSMPNLAFLNPFHLLTAQ